MSKAFTREDDADDAPVLPRPVPLLPPGARNYLTAAGARRLREELQRLAEVERPKWLAQAGETGARGAEAKEELQRVEQRMAHLGQCLQSAEIVAPPLPPHDTVRFGATVTVRDARGQEMVYRIVGADEADFARDEVSWLSPIAKALLNARLGQKVACKLPAGTTTLEVVRIAYG
ncbi:MAG: GreA/GreB family elongation factor [Opitutae bacterium]|nr:GreA/GreB family elongation factor [Opitutae bacterium]